MMKKMKKKKINLNPIISPVGPIGLENIKLKGYGSEMSFPSGDFTEYLVIKFLRSNWPQSSI